VARRGPAALTDAGRTLTDRPRLWPVFLSCLAAFVAIVAFSLVAGAIVRELYPDLSGRAAFEGLPGLLALTIASSAGFILTALIASGGGTAAALRLMPGTESGRALLVMTLGTLALGQTLDSLVTLAGLAQHGSMVTIRRALAEAVGPDLLLAVLVVGLVAGTAEETFFRGYMQTRLAQRLPRAAAIAITALCFGLFHVDWLHGLLALALGLYLGWITELTGSALPAVVCHVINNALFTILTASLGMIEGFRINVALGVGGALVFAGCVAWLRVSPRVRRTSS
jgi:membrane protease YdiL (CAAX protease family)